MKKELNYFTAFRFLSIYILRYKRNFIMFYLGWLFDTVLAVSMPILFGVMIDEIVYYQNQDTFMKLSLIFIVMSVFSCVLYFLIYAQHHYLMNMYTFDIKIALFEHLQLCDAQYMTAASSGELIKILQTYPEECMHFVIRNFIHRINDMIIVTAVTVYLFLIRWQIGVLVLADAPLTVWIHTKYGGRIRKSGDLQRKCYGRYISWVFEMLSAVRDIRLMGAQQKVDSDFNAYHKNLFAINIKSGIAVLTAGNIMRFSTLAVQLLIFSIAGYFAVSGQITIGLLTIIVSFYEQLADTLTKISRSYLDAQNRIAYIQRIYDLLHAPSELDWAGTRELEITAGTVCFENIHFSYTEDISVLKNFNLNIPGGTRFALTGKSGCGKTTIAYMLLGFYQPHIGAIIIDGQRLAECSLRSLRRNIGLISQEVLIFEGTIRDNLLLGNPNATIHELETAYRQSGLWEFIQDRPGGLSSTVGIQGCELSGGQKQRIAIARIYLKNPKIIIFDEATSALDNQTEEAIHAAWERVLAGRTAIIIAHRQSSVMRCNSAAILADGTIVETGAPEKLAKESDVFQTLFSIKDDEAFA